MDILPKIPLCINMNIEIHEYHIVGRLIVEHHFDVRYKHILGILNQSVYCEAIQWCIILKYWYRYFVLVDLLLRYVFNCWPKMCSCSTKCCSHLYTIYEYFVILFKFTIEIKGRTDLYQCRY